MELPRSRPHPRRDRQALPLSRGGGRGAHRVRALDLAGRRVLPGRFRASRPLVEGALEAAVDRERQRVGARRSRASCGSLGTIGATAPFIGLFGTVWGILRAFEQIGVTQQAGIDVVGPGIAEALVTTAAGIVVAIEAVVIYNYFMARLSAHHDRAQADGRRVRRAPARAEAGEVVRKAEGPEGGRPSPRRRRRRRMASAGPRVTAATKRASSPRSTSRRSPTSSSCC